MSVTTPYLFAVAVLLQVAAVAFAARMMRRHGRGAPWLMLGAALSLMLCFRVFGLLTAGPRPALPLSDDAYHLISALISLWVSALFFVSLFSIRRVISARDQSETARSASEERLRMSLKSGHTGTWEYDVVNNRVTWSEQIYEFHGLPVGSFGGRVEDFPPLIHPDDRERVSEAVRKAIEERAPYSTEYRALRPDGALRWIVTSGEVIFDDAGKPVQMLGAATDITDRKRAEDALRNSEERWQLAVRAAQDGIWDWNLATGELYWSPRCKEMLGYADDELTVADAAAVQALLHPDDVAHGWENAQRHLRGETPMYTDEYRMRHKDGSYRWILSRGRAMSDASGRPARMAGSNTDITDRKRLEQDLREAERKYRAIFEATRDGLIINAPDGSVVEANPAACRMHGYTYEEFMTPPASRFIHPDDLPQFARYVEALGRGEEFRTEARDVRKDGTVFPVEVIGTSFTYKGVPHLLGVVRDITERKAAERERQELLDREHAARLEAERSSRAKDEFIAVLSHELRTPLTPVLLTVSVLESHPGLPAELRADVAAIRRNVELESRLIGDLLDLTRISRGKVQLEKQTVDVHALLRSAIAICQREDSVRMEIDLAATNAFVEADATRMQQVFWNLVSNAQKFTPPGGMIAVRTRDAEGGRIRIEVSDSGEGIDPAILPRLFNAFEQGEVRTTRQFAGLGLGLAISKRLVDAHGGTITAHSGGKNCGATFVVELDSVAPPAVREGQAPPTAGPVPAGALKILLVEDHEATANVLAKLLRNLGHEVKTALTLSSALAAANAERFDLLLSDIGLPDGTGLDLMRRLGPAYAGRGIALTGYGMEEDVRSTTNAGFVAHVTKPVDFDRLKDIINELAGINGVSIPD